MARVNLSIDVPDLDAGLAFYQGVFGFPEVARPFASMAILQAENLTICVHAKGEGTRPTLAEGPVRTYSRHWTPVHIDVHVEDLDATLARAVALGATLEQSFRGGPHSDVVVCADPFGNGFCLLGPSRG